MVGAARFELATTCTPCRYATRLRYAPKGGILPLELVENRAQLPLDRANVDAHAALRAAAAYGGLGFLLVRAPIVEAVAGTADGESFLVQELADAADQQHLVVLVIAAVATALHGLSWVNSCSQYRS